uniref:Pheromone-binding protein Gp-9 n=1 Tax=Odontomachus monticola TaxID=613454 RepID=A0A348G654_ODOMO
MKVLAFCTCVLALICFSSAETTGERLKQAFSLEQDNFDNCLTANNMTAQDLYTDVNIVNGEHEGAENEERRKKNGCTLECLLKAEGLMVGSDIKEGKVHAQISRTMNGNSMEGKAHKLARDCIREVKNITEECEKGFSLIVCLAKGGYKARNHGEHERE